MYIKKKQKKKKRPIINTGSSIKDGRDINSPDETNPRKLIFRYLVAPDLEADIARIPQNPFQP